MKKLIKRLQKDLATWQATIQKEGNDLLEKIRKVDLKDNLDTKKKEIEKVLEAKLRRFEPAYHNFLDELAKNAKKAGIDIGRLEVELKKTADAAKKKLHRSASKKASSAKKSSKRAKPVAAKSTKSTKNTKNTKNTKKAASTANASSAGAKKKTAHKKKT